MVYDWECDLPSMFWGYSWHWRSGTQTGHTCHTSCVQEEKSQNAPQWVSRWSWATRVLTSHSEVNKEGKERQPQESGDCVFCWNTVWMPIWAEIILQLTLSIARCFLHVYKPTPFIQPHILLVFKAFGASLEYILLVVIGYNLSWRWHEACIMDSIFFISSDGE